MRSSGLENEYDVVICGGGLAGLTLARQLKMEIPDVSVAIVDRLSRPLPESAFKVGESLVETGSHYLAEKLQLKDYLDQHHIRKLGFRFFYGDARGPFHARPEFGLSEFPMVNSYQLDRGRLENDLREFNLRDGVDLLEGCIIKDIQLGRDGEFGHRVRYARSSNRQEGELRARWVVDAMGRRRYLQKRLNLTKEHGKKCSAVWFRLEGRIDVGDLVPAEVAEWHNRVPGRNRFFSTNHLMGNGYWVWLIPLSSNTTSVGIVALEEFYSFEEFNTYKRALDWLYKNEPALAAYLDGRTPLDFRVMREYSYSSKQLFSFDRWACIGEAAIFADPFYALASDLIGFENSILTEMIRQDLKNQLTPDTVDEYNKFVLALNHWLTSNIQLGYPFFGNGVVMACKVMWDTAGGWSNLGPQMFNSVFLSQETQSEFRRVSGRFFFLTRAMQQLFHDWAEMSQGNCSYTFIDFLKVPIMKRFQQRNLKTGKTAEEIIRDQIKNMEELEEFAQTIFLIAVEEIYPEKLHLFEEPVWLNAWAISLHPERWEPDGLFEPLTPPRDLAETRAQLKKLFRFSHQLQDAAVAVP